MVTSPPCLLLARSLDRSGRRARGPLIVWERLAATNFETFELGGARQQGLRGCRGWLSAREACTGWGY